MLNPWKILREKEAQIESLHKDIEALRRACRLLYEEGDELDNTLPRPNVQEPWSEEKTDGTL
jgi:hypothetical protein